jgi:uncharacterized repeat protein (TIGR03803 family)
VAHIPVERYGKEDKPMYSKRQSLSSRFCTISLVIIAALVMAVTIVPSWAQNSVPPTAVQAAKMPEFASRLAHNAKHVSAPKSSALAPAKGRFRPLQGNDIYDNGPINGTTDAWTINFGFVVSDSFTVTQGNGTPITGMSFGAWLVEGDTLESAQLSITSGENGGTSYFNQTLNFTQSACSANQYSYNVCTETSSSFNVSLNNGTYWVNLQNATTADGEPIYWDENSGVGCTGPGCPSSASESSVGTIPSESFTILGGGTCANLPKSDGAPAEEAKVATVPPSPTQTFRVLYNFTGAADGGRPQAMVMDAAGNLYGTANEGGSSGLGTVFKLTPTASGWRFTRLYSFSGADGSGPDSPPALASNGSVYGTTNYGGGGGVGVLFGLTSSGEVLPAVFSNWTESLLYSFTGGSDGARPGGSLVIDGSGNIYGTAYGGGANDGGTLYEFTNGGIQVLHAFPAFPGDGTDPQGVVSGAGGLYGTTYGGGAYGTGTVYTLAGGYNILYDFDFSGQGENGWPLYLAADQAGNLYGSATYGYLIHGCYYVWYGTIFELTYPDWTLVTLMNWGNLDGPLSAGVTPDAAGNVYGTVNTGAGDGEVFKLTCCWSYTPLHDFSGSDGAEPTGAPVIDTQGNIYGTTNSGGAYNYGVVWEISP